MFNFVFLEIGIQHCKELVDHLNKICSTRRSSQNQMKGRLLSVRSQQVQIMKDKINKLIIYLEAELKHAHNTMFNGDNEEDVDVEVDNEYNSAKNMKDEYIHEIDMIARKLIVNQNTIE